MPPAVMIVEDDEALSDVLKYNLIRAGYRVGQVWNGTDAVARLKEERPDLLLLDIMLPGINGWEVCRSMADDESLRDTPVVVFTAKSAREDFDQARQFNVAGYFTKPYATADVVRHVQKVLGTPAPEEA